MSNPSYSSRTRLGRLLVTIVLAAIPPAGHAGEPAKATAQVPKDLQLDPTYAQYAAMLIQVDLLSQPETADLPITVEPAEPGLILLRGTVPNDRVKRYVEANARRISGLMVRDALRLGTVPQEDARGATKGELEHDTRETISTFFPERAKQLTLHCSDDGVVAIHGEVDSMQTKLLLSQSVKSQRGCRAVANLTAVIVDPTTNRLAVTDDGRARVPADRLPVVPAAEPLDFPDRKDEPARRSGSMRAQSADDDSEPQLADQQLREAVRAQLATEPDLSESDLEIEAQAGVVSLSGTLASREQVQHAVQTVSAVPGVSKVVANCKPVSIQRNLPAGGSRDQRPDPGSAKDGQRRKLFGILPLAASAGAEGDEGHTRSRRFRETVRRTLKKRCDERLTSLKVRSSLRGLVIEAEVKNHRDRTFVFKQIDNVVELRDVEYDAVVRVREL